METLTKAGLDAWRSDECGAILLLRCFLKSIRSRRHPDIDACLRLKKRWYLSRTHPPTEDAFHVLENHLPLQSANTMKTLVNFHNAIVLDRACVSKLDKWNRIAGDIVKTQLLLHFIPNLSRDICDVIFQKACLTQYSSVSSRF